MIQKRIKFPKHKKNIVTQRSTSDESKQNYKIKMIKEPNSRINNLYNCNDFEKNQVNSTITSVSTSTTNTAKNIYIYRKNMNKQKNAIRLIKQQSKNKIINFIHSPSTDNRNKNKSSKTIEINEYNIIDSNKNNNNKDNTISNINDNYFDNNDKNINKKYHNGTTPKKKYYKHNIFKINSGPNIFKKGVNLNNNEHFCNQSFYSTRIQYFKKKNEIINVEDILLLEEKFNDIKYALKNKSNIANECFEIIDFYTQSSLFNKFENYFKKYSTQKIIHSSILLIIFDLILTYHVSFDDLYINTYYDYLNKIMHMNHQSYLLICDYISNKVSSSENGNIWVKKLRQMLMNEISHLNINSDKDFNNFIIKKNLVNNNMIMPLKEINFYVYTTQKYLTILLNNLSEEDDLKSLLIDIYNNIFEISPAKIYKLFKNHIFRIINKNGSIYGNDISLYETNHIEIKEPYLNYKNTKKFTLVLDLDETLICFKLLPDKNKGLLKLRPGLFPFLLKLKPFYELIIFTSATPEYADPLLEAIEKGQKLFDYKLYRQHTIIYNNEIAKDISKLGRNLDKVIIVDNLKQNFRLQKENGIMIKPFWGEDNDDEALFDLCEILKNIANEFNDVRKGIIKYKDDILSKVSSTVSRNSFENNKF